MRGFKRIKASRFFAIKGKPLMRSGEGYILLTGVSLILSLAMVAYMVAIILFRGLGFFWPKDVIWVELKNGQIYLGEQYASGSRMETNAEDKSQLKEEIQLKIGNRDLYGRDFIWLNQKDIRSIQKPEMASVLERAEYGNFYGMLLKLQTPEKTFYPKEADFWGEVQNALRRAHRIRDQIKDLEQQLNAMLMPLTKLHREISLLEIAPNAGASAAKLQLRRMETRADSLERALSPRIQEINSSIQKLRKENERLKVALTTAEGLEYEISLQKVVRLYQPNRMSWLHKLQFYVGKVWEFISGEPRESNTEGGIFPAIFGTVMMVLIMSIAVVPFGVMAAIYLNEYASQGPITRLIRLSVSNLAGVPSIVYGVFGLGFFIYLIGGSIDQLFFSSKLPEPTFGTGGILWASLTLALLTVPVVVVATEEGILAVPKANKEAALALGATRWQMIRRVVIPGAMPGILTGLILAISRGAGEVAPLMITGVVKLAPNLPVDGDFPFLHLDRKFMHLGFHIYDVGFQSPNVEAAKPMVYTTALLLIVIVVLLNLMAILLRNYLRRKHRTSTF